MRAIPKFICLGLMTGSILATGSIASIESVYAQSYNANPTKGKPSIAPPLPAKFGFEIKVMPGQVAQKVNKGPKYGRGPKVDKGPRYDKGNLK